MSRLPPNEMMITADDVRKTSAPLPRLIHNLFYGLGITHGRYHDHYMEYASETWKDEPKSKIHPKLGANRSAIKERRSATFYLLTVVLAVLKKDLVRITIDLRDRTTGEEMSISSTDTVEDLDRKRQEQESFGVNSL